MSGQRLQLWLLLVGAGVAVALGHAIPVCFEGRLPQTPGEDVLSLILGDARLELSRALGEKAEEYFHGGVRNVNCTIHSDAGGHGHEGHDAEARGITEGEPHATHQHGEERGHISGHAPAGGLWQWINASVHEQAHRHLEGMQMVEVLPWFWAACRLSAKNSQAYESSAYVLAYELGKPEEAARLLEDGIRKDPAKPELDFFLGEICFSKLRDMMHAETCFVSAREKCLVVQRDAARAEELLRLRLRAVFYLGYLAKQRGDIDRVRLCLAEAESLAPRHNIVRDLRVLLEKTETRNQ